MILTTELPQELLHRLRDHPLRLSAMRSALLAANLEGVWWGSRASFDQDGARQLGECLQTAQPELFVVYEPTTEQTLVVNRRLLRERLAETVLFIEVGGKEPALLETAPLGAQKLLEAIANHAATSSFCLLDLDPPGRTSDLIPLAGILLDYATAYCVNSGDGSNCLGGRELHLIEAFSITAGGQRNHLFSFSYPAEIVSSTPALKPNAVVAQVDRKLQARFREAQQRYPELVGFSMEVKYSTVTLDQVAL
ncbi:hypothetical protein C6P46_005444 [Rhodotorula mucilaginosa]|uniref:Uncharacterized protein n=1 Tax=Rhodotorula mucilaginosa TaxID=5537 RepID=A0A9P6W943_RHOMI|nr:hypothetical protein C6P46_005444 [Rhodotorula mucilaginosa]